MATTTVLRAQMGTDSYCRVWHRWARRTWASHPTRTLPSSSASRAPRLIVNSRHELSEKVSTRPAMLLPCQLTTTASLRVLLQHCWQDPGAPPPDPLPQTPAWSLQHLLLFTLPLLDSIWWFECRMCSLQVFDCWRRSRPGASLQLQQGEFVNVVQGSRFTSTKSIIPV